MALMNGDEATMRLFERLLFTLTLVALGGCATAADHVRIARYGAVDTTADQELADKAEALPWHKDYPVVVVRGTLPPGISIDKDGSIEVDRSATGETEVLGTVSSEADPSAFIASTIWYADLHPSEGVPRDAFCKAQLPLRVVTLSLWSYLTPFGWVCLAVPRGDDRGFRLHLQELRRAAYAMGGNMVVLIGQTDLITSRDGVVVGRVEGVHIKALVLKTPSPSTLKVAEGK